MYRQTTVCLTRVRAKGPTELAPNSLCYISAMPIRNATHRILHMWMLTGWSLAGCSSGPLGNVKETDTGRPAAWSVLADKLPGGVFLSAWSDGAAVRIVGGPPGGGPSVMLRWESHRLCIEESTSESTLWWIHGPRAGE